MNVKATFPGSHRELAVVQFSLAFVHVRTRYGGSDIEKGVLTSIFIQIFHPRRERERKRAYRANIFLIYD